LQFEHQQKMPVIGFLPATTWARRLRQPLIEDCVSSVTSRAANILIEYRWAEGKVERFLTLAAELVALKVDVIMSAGGSLGALAAKRSTTVIPIVFGAVGNPVAEATRCTRTG
jgi:putative ABC transport system substrate-binding protein